MAKNKGTKFSKFAWQNGYSVFSVGHTQISEVKKYIAKQKSHHAKTPFETEMRAFYRKYDLEFDKQYVWG